MQCIQQLPASTWKSLPGAAQPGLVAGPQPHGGTSAAKKSPQPARCSDPISTASSLASTLVNISQGGSTDLFRYGHPHLRRGN